MKKLFLLVTSLTLVFGLARTSSAETILFDVDGVAGGTVVSVDDFDWVPGNSMLMESGVFVPCDTNPFGDTCQTATILFQANLNSMTLGSPAVSVYTNGVGGDYFTAVASVDVILNGLGGFDLVPDSGVFNIYADSTGPGDDLSGLGFTDGTLILSGTSLIGSGTVVTTANSQDNLLPPVNAECAATNDQDPTGGLFIQCLDQFGANNYLNYYTLLASGGGTFAVDFLNVTDFIDTNYFLNLDQTVAFSFTGTASNLPFKDTNPSARFSSDAVANGDILGAGTTNICGPGQLGTAASPCVNGTGNNIIVQTDAHTSFQGLVAGEVPEPATLSLLGLGLLGSAAARRRQLRNKR